jgi:hypothetical protein
VEIAVRSNLIDSFCSGAILTGPGTPEAINLRDAPGRVTVRSGDLSVGGRELRGDFPPFSLTLLEAAVAAGKGIPR